MVTCEATLEEVGEGTLELTEQYLIFYVKKGFFTKHDEVVREINIADIKSLKQTEGTMEVTWKGVETFTDTFVIDNAELLAAIYKSATKSLEKHRETVKKKADAEQKRDKLAATLTITIKAINTLFDMLISLNGKVIWPHVENLQETFEKDFDKVKKTSTEKVTFKLDELGSAIENRSPEEAVKEAYSILKEIHEFFSKLASVKDKFLEELHPNYSDAFQVVQACYVLNDIALAVTVADEKVEEEITTLVATLENLANKTNLKTDANAVRSAINKLVTEGKTRKAIDESRRKFEEHIEGLLL